MIYPLAILMLQTGLSFLVGFSIEAIAIADEGNTARNVGFNCICTVFYLLAEVSITTFIVTRLLGAITLLRLPAVIDFSKLSDHGHVVAGLVLVSGWLIVRDFFYYWMHRLQHYSKWLWAEHELHHSEEHMNATTANRHHWLETSLEAIFVTTPLLLLFHPPTITAVLAAVAAGFSGIFIHLNSRISLGPLNRVIANPSTHRIHHSKAPEHIDKNFAAFFPIWDVLFGTYVSPKRGEFPATGLASGELIDSPKAAILGPLIAWASMLKPHFTAKKTPAQLLSREP
jgi:sterol desaturase/sphingolipid hydroxylase (fatty acid hydroxylase superfamily)